MSALARDTGLNRGNLYEALSEDGNPTLATLLKITRSLGLRLHLEPVENPAQGAATDQTHESPGTVNFDVSPQSTPSAPSTPKCSPRVPNR